MPSEPVQHIFVDGHEYTLTSEMNRRIRELEEQVVVSEEIMQTLGLELAQVRNTVSTNAHASMLALQNILSATELEPIRVPIEQAVITRGMTWVSDELTPYEVGMMVWATHEFIGDGVTVTRGQVGRILRNDDGEVTIELMNGDRTLVYESLDTLPVRWSAERPASVPAPVPADTERVLASDDLAASWHERLVGDDD